MNVIVFIKQEHEALRVVFTQACVNQNISDVSSLKMSQAFELLCPECIITSPYDTGINVIAAGTCNPLTSCALLSGK